MALLCRRVVVDCNRAFIDSLVGAARVVVGVNIAELIAEDYLPQFARIAQRGMECDKMVLKFNGDAKRSVLAQFWPLNSDYGLFSFTHDYKTDRIADWDALTQIPNRRHANVLLGAAQATDGDGFCLALGDIDFCKTINDTRGHSGGDAALRYVAGIISSELRRGDWVARWGGDEFLICIKNDDLAMALQPLERIRAQLNRGDFSAARADDAAAAALTGMTVTMSFGVVSSSSMAAVGLSTERLINRADRLLYDAKSGGRNRIASAPSSPSSPSSPLSAHLI